MDTSTLQDPPLGIVSALIVDDNVLARRCFVRLAEETNVEFFLKEACSVQEFGEMLDNDKFDIIFVDLHLEADHGLALLPIVRRHHVNGDAALIMIANDTHSDTALAALRAGFSEFIEKEALSSVSLERAAVNAMQKQRLSNAASTARDIAASNEALLASFAHACGQEMRPLMARLMRHVRQLTPFARENDVVSVLQNIETDCSRINGFFSDIEALGDEGSLSEFINESPPGASEPARSRPRQEKASIKQESPVHARNRRSLFAPHHSPST